MSKPIIEIENVGKRYRIGSSKERYLSLRDEIAKLASKLGKLGGGAPMQDFWALEDVSFCVSEGEAVGIIGRNGAGKSTLLKILSQITPPTKGKIIMRGRVASLLEVGTGFHPELTGRENIFLNGTILGMTRREVARKFDEIVAFAEVEKFLDTPVKRYSSGMYVRLAFAVAAHLEPEIMVVDEVLAVGDAGFQKKCLGKMGDVAKSGRTVLFVSHNMAAVTRLCQRAVMLGNGHLIEDGLSDLVIAHYQQSGSGSAAQNEWCAGDPRAPQSEWVRLKAIRVLAEDGDVALTHDIRKPVCIELVYEVLKPGVRLIPKFDVVYEDGVTAFVVGDTDLQWRKTVRNVGTYRSRLMIPGNFLSEGNYSIMGAIVSHDPDITHFLEPDLVSFQIVDYMDGDTARGDFAGHMPGVVRPIMPWVTDYLT